MSDTTEVTQCKIYFDGKEVLPFTQESEIIEVKPMLSDRFKFRIYKKIEHKMVYDVTYLNPQLLDSRINDNADNYVVMQSVNLRDCNGTLIYEGDIVALPYGSFIVKYCDECKQYQLFYNDMCYGCEGDIHWVEFAVDTETRNVKVIGNIYESNNIQELLEEW